MGWVSTFSAEAMGFVRARSSTAASPGTVGAVCWHGCSQVLLSSRLHWSHMLPRPPGVVSCVLGVITWCCQALCWKHEECFLGGHPGGQGTPWWGSSKTLLPFSNQNENIVIHLHVTSIPHVKRNKFSYHRAVLPGQDLVLLCLGFDIWLGCIFNQKPFVLVLLNTFSLLFFSNDLGFGQNLRLDCE